MKTAARGNPNRRVTVPRNRAHGAVGQNSSCSIEWAEKQEKVQPKEKCFFLTSPFIELTRSWPSPLGRDPPRTPNCASTVKMVATRETTQVMESLGHRRSGVGATLRQSARRSEPHAATRLSRSTHQAQGLPLSGAFVVKRFENSRSIFPPIRPPSPTAALVKTRPTPRFAWG